MMQTPSQRPMQATPSVVSVQLRFVGQPVLRTGGSGETGCGQVISQATGFWLRGAVCLNYTIMDDVAAVATGRTIERTHLRMNGRRICGGGKASAVIDRGCVVSRTARLVDYCDYPASRLLSGQG